MCIYQINQSIPCIRQVGFDSTLEFAPMEGDLAREDEARLIEELENVKSEIKNMKIRQAMVNQQSTTLARFQVVFVAFRGNTHSHTSIAKKSYAHN